MKASHLFLVTMTLIPSMAASGQERAVAPAVPLQPSAIAGSLVVRVADGDDTKLRQAHRDLEITEHRIRVAERALESAEIAVRSGVHLAERELEMARFDREKFDNLVRPRRIAEKELQLQRSKDRAREAADELEQIEIMYAEQDLDDKTAEFVISRGRRNAERSARDVDLQEQALEAFVSYELRKEADKLDLDVERKELALDAARRNGETDVLRKQIGVMEAQAKMEGLQDSIEKIKLDLVKEKSAAKKASSERSP